MILYYHQHLSFMKSNKNQMREGKNLQDLVGDI